jgi:hypothetical protein
MALRMDGCETITTVQLCQSIGGRLNGYRF